MIHQIGSRHSAHRATPWRLHDGALIAAGKSVALTLMVIALWGIMHVYKGLTGDAELYAVQALSKILPGLSSDLYLQNDSQDRFTIFSSLYSVCIRWWGLQHAALTLTTFCTVWFMIAAWALSRALSNGATAFLAVAVLIIIKGTYGSYGVFSYGENWITARSLAEAMVVTAVACHFLDKKRLGLLIAASALVVHPIMALPGLVLLICLWLSLRAAAITMGLGILAVLVIALLGLIHPQVAGPLTQMDPEWLEIVHERSQFLFLQYWTLDDWEITSIPFLYLTFYAVANSGPIRKLALVAMAVGAAGLIVAAIAGLIGPVAILVQGQAWRWMWVTTFVSVLLLAPTAQKIWNDEKCGPLCVTLLILGWTFVVMDRDVCVALALFLWLVRNRISSSSGRYLRWATAALGMVVAAWVIGNSWSIFHAPSPESGRDSAVIADLRNVFGLGVSAVVTAWLLFYCIKVTRSMAVLCVISALLAVGATFALRGSLMQNFRAGSATEVNEFNDWRSLIPATATVYVVPAHSSGTFAWFTLERPSYLTVDQSAGVVFSRATALEVKRRSLVLVPVLDPDWRLLTRNTQKDSGEIGKSVTRPLTRENLYQICGDPILKFVVAQESIGFESTRHTHAGNWKDWNLYNCRRVRDLASNS